MDGGSGAQTWLVAESLPQLLLLQPDEQLRVGDVQVLGDSPWAHSAMNRSDSLAAEGDAVLCRHFALARISAGNSCGDPARTDRSGHDQDRVTPGADRA